VDDLNLSAPSWPAARRHVRSCRRPEAPTSSRVRHSTRPGASWASVQNVCTVAAPSGLVTSTRRSRVAAELISDLERIYQREKAADKELTELLTATGSTLTQLNGIGPSGAARLFVEVADITRFPTKAHFASWNGTAPIDASSGQQVRHRLSRAGNRQINRVLHIMAVVQLRHRDSKGRAYYDRNVAVGKTPMEAMRCLKRRLSDVVYRQMVADANAAATGPGGHSGTTVQSSVTGLTPAAGSSDKPLPGPASQQTRTLSLKAP
jgi:transposase